MTTVIPGFEAHTLITGDVLNQRGADWLNAWLLAQMQRDYPTTEFVVVAEGKASSEWNRLVRGNGYAEPTPDQWHTMDQLFADCWDDVPADGWGEG